MRSKLPGYTITVTLIAALSGCSFGDGISAGYVTSKKYDKPYVSTEYEHTCAAYDPKTFACTVPIVTPRTVNHPANWRLYLKDGDKRGWVDVDETAFSKFTTGMHYPDPR